MRNFLKKWSKNIYLGPRYGKKTKKKSIFFAPFLWEIAYLYIPEHLRLKKLKTERIIFLAFIGVTIFLGTLIFINVRYMVKLVEKLRLCWKTLNY